MQANQSRAAERSREKYNKGRQEKIFQEGNWVLLDVRSHALQDGERKQVEKFSGPYVIKQQVHPNAYELSGLPPHLPKTQNVEFLRRFLPSIASFEGRPEASYARPIQQSDGQIEWEVEEILDEKKKGNQR